LIQTCYSPFRIASYFINIFVIA